MRLADDERGRVPFALIGVLLLVSSVAIATVQLDDSRVDRDAALAGDRTESILETTLRDAVRDAGARAASNPVVTPAATPYGEALDPDRPYRSYLELLVAIELRERLDGTPQQVDGATATVDLEPIGDPAAAEAAIERIQVESAGRGLVRARIADVPIVLRRGGSAIGHRERTVTATVTTPALTLHERTETFQSRLDGDTLDSGTLNRGLTGSLWSLAWARGYGQYSGIPFENVIANDHVELITNLAALDVQRSVFGRADGQGEDRLADRTAQVVANEQLPAAGGVFEEAALPTNASAPVDAPTVDSPDPPTRTIGVNDTADRALADVIEVASRDEVDPQDVVDAESGGGLASGSVSYGDEIVPEGVAPWPYSQQAIARTAASIDARLLSNRRTGDATLVSTDPAPSAEWNRGIVVDSGDPSVASVRNGSAPVPDAGTGWSTHREVERTVVLERTDVVRYVNATSGESHHVEERYRREVDVGLALVTRPVQRDWIPDAELDRRSDGYQSLVDRSSEQLLANPGPDPVAALAATGDPSDAETVVSPDDVDSVADAAYDDVVDLRETVRGVSTTGSTAHVLTDDESPHAELASTVRDRSARYRDVPARYDVVGDRSTVALRGVYIDRVLRRLDARSDGSGGAREDISSAVSSATSLPGVGLSDFFEVGMDYSRPDPASIEARDPAPDLELTVDADPSYLSTDVESDTRVPPPDDPYHPMSARTTTISSLPTDELTKRVTEIIVSVFGFGEEEKEKTAPPPVAARALQSSENLTRKEIEDQGLGGPRGTLEADLEDVLGTLEDRSAEALVAETALDETQAEDVVTEALSIYDRPGGAILAFDDGSASARIAAVATDEYDVDATDADRAQTVIRADVDEHFAADDSQVALDTVESVAGPTRDVIEQSVGRAIERANERGEEVVRERILDQTRFSMLPTRGFPVAPVPQWWLVTANVWHVEVHGTYASFAVRADQGGPSGGSHVSYVRDGQSALVDVDGDGDPERLGRSDRIQFTATSTVAVAVPRGGGGVGNNETGFAKQTDGWDPPRPNWNVCESPGGSGPFGETDYCRRERDGQ